MLVQSSTRKVSISDALVDFSRDEDSDSFTFSLTNLADDVQDEESDLTWTVDEGTLVAFDNILVDWSQNGQDVTVRHSPTSSATWCSP